VSDPILLGNIVVSAGVVIISLSTVVLGWSVARMLAARWRRGA